MGRPSLHPGVWTGFLGLVFAGIFAILAAPVDRIYLNYAGYLSIVFGSCLAIWGLKIDDVFWWKPRVVIEDVSGRDWAPLHLALRYIALRSRWAFSVNENDTNKLDKLLEKVILERLARGELDARGRKVMGPGARTTQTTIEIEKVFWETAFIQPFAEIVLVEDDRGAASRNGSFTHVPAASYRGVILDMGQVKKKWPEQPLSDRRTRKSNFHDALIRYFLGDDEREFAEEFAMWAASSDAPLP